MTQQKTAWPIKKEPEVIKWQGRATSDPKEFARVSKESERPYKKEEVEAVMARFMAFDLAY